MLKKVTFKLFCLLLIFSWGMSAVEAQTATIEANTVQQYIRGFGAANIIGWRDDLTSTDRVTAFSVDNGIGLSVLRVRVSPDSGDWASNIATMNAAKSNGALVIASAWSAPASMKTNNSTTQGNLKTGSYAAYATHLRDFCSAVGGVSAISPINEPNIQVSYESMEMSASDIAAFVAAQGKNCGAPIMAPEPFNMSQSYINNYLSNSGAKANTTYIAGHIYGTSPSSFNPGKEIWMTEHYVDSSESTGNGNNWTKSMKVAKELHDCMNAGYSMYVWWYIKRYYGPIDESGNITKTGYVMSHFARYVRPGFNKIGCTANPQSGVYTTAYKSGADLVIVVVNQKSSSTSQSFNLRGISVSGFNRWDTTSSANLKADSFTISGNSFGINLPASSITTLVSSNGSTNPTTPPPTPTPTPSSTVAPVILNPGSTLTLQAEDVSNSAAVVESIHAGFTGSGYVNYENAPGGYIEWVVTAAAAMKATCTFMFANGGSAARPCQVSVNGGNAGSVDFPATGIWTTWDSASVTVNLSHGNNSIRLTCTGSEGGPNVDRMEISTSGSQTGSLGDVNSDNRITIVDALMTAQYYVGLNPSGFNAANADVNCDGSINIVDALMTAQYYVGIITVFSC